MYTLVSRNWKVINHPGYVQHLVDIKKGFISQLFKRIPAAESVNHTCTLTPNVEKVRYVPRVQECERDPSAVSLPRYQGCTVPYRDAAGLGLREKSLLSQSEINSVLLLYHKYAGAELWLQRQVLITRAKVWACSGIWIE